MLKNRLAEQNLTTEPSLSFNQQCLRILRCTANALASSPGGLRFKPGTRPWLEDLQSVRCLQPIAIK